jgi:hypothetical protein
MKRLNDYKIEYLDTETGEILNLNPDNIEIGSYTIYDNDYLIIDFRENIKKILDRKSAYNLLKYLKYISPRLYNNLTIDDLYKKEY